MQSMLDVLRHAADCQDAFSIFIRNLDSEFIFNLDDDFDAFETHAVVDYILKPLCLSPRPRGSSRTIRIRGRGSNLRGRLHAQLFMASFYRRDIAVCRVIPAASYLDVGVALALMPQFQLRAD